MSTTTHEARCRLRAEQQAELRAKSEDASPGLRFRVSKIGRSLASGESFGTTTQAVEVFEDPEQTARFLRRRAFVDDGLLTSLPDARRQVQIFPRPTPLLAMVTQVPTTSPVIPVVPADFQIDDAGIAADFTNLPGTPGVADTGTDAIKWTVDYLNAKRVGRAVEAPLVVFQDPGQAEALVDRLITQNWCRAVENLLVSGSTDTNLIGITQTEGMASTSASGIAPPDALAAGVAEVMDAGFYTDHAVIASPRTLRGIWTAKDTSDNYLRYERALPTVTGWVPSAGLPDGTAIVCAPAELYLYLEGSFLVEMSQGVLDYYSRGLVLVTGAQRAAIWLRSPQAFVVVTDLPTPTPVTTA